MDYLVSLTIIVARVLPTVTPFDVMWRIPWATISYLVVAEARSRDVKGIGDPDKDRKLWERYMELTASKTD